MSIPKFKNSQYLKQALVHRSYLNESNEFSQSNERLEFLGDSILQVLTSTYLYHRFPDYAEGQLTNLRSMIVRTTSLAQLARELDLGKDLQMSRGEKDSGGQDNESLLADTAEAIIGALYLDSGFEAVDTFLKTVLYSKVDRILEENKVFDYKSMVQEFTQKEFKQSPIYSVLKTSGPDHNRVFTIGLYLADKLIARGQGKSKQTAQQEAAKEALEKLREKG